MGIFIRLLFSSFAVIIASYLVPGVTVSNFLSAVLVAIVLGVLNGILKPILILLTLPVTILTLGLFTFVINAVIILLTSAIIPGFVVNGFLSALLFALVLSIVNGLTALIVKY